MTQDLEQTPGEKIIRIFRLDHVQQVGRGDTTENPLGHLGAYAVHIQKHQEQVFLCLVRKSEEGHGIFPDHQVRVQQHLGVFFGEHAAGTGGDVHPVADACYVHHREGGAFLYQFSANLFNHLLAPLEVFFCLMAWYSGSSSRRVSRRRCISLVRAATWALCGPLR